MNSKKVTLQTIADSLGVSKVTVYKALNDKPDIGEELRERIRSKCAELNYKTVDPLAKLTHICYFLFPKQFYISTEQYYFGIYKKLSTVLAAAGVKLEINFIDDNFDPVRFADQRKKLAGVSAGMFIAGEIASHQLRAFEQAQLPCVCIDYFSDKYKLNYIYIDNFRAGYHLTNYMVAQGHRDICFMIDINRATTNMDKYFGFRKALHKNGIAFSARNHLNLDLAKPQNAALLRLPDPLPSAFLFDCDSSAYNFSIYMLSKGFTLPRDVSIASFDNTDICTDMAPKLTSMGPNLDELTAACYRLMLAALRNPAGEKQSVTLFSTLHERDSVAAVLPRQG